MKSTWRMLDCFAGIGGFSLGFQAAGIETCAFVEKDKYCQKVLKKHWPELPIIEDIKHVTKERFDSDGIDTPNIICGGFPCQDISTTKVHGKRSGIHGSRSGLFFELLRVVSEIRPKYLVMENVTGLLTGNNGQWFGRILSELEQVGYCCEWHCIHAASFGAIHQRDRVWFIAHPNSKGLQGREKTILQKRHITEGHTRQGIRWQSKSRICRVADGIPNRVDRLRTLGNAIFPPIAECIAGAIIEHEKSN